MSTWWAGVLALHMVSGSIASVTLWIILLRPIFYDDTADGAVDDTTLIQPQRQQHDEQSNSRALSRNDRHWCVRLRCKLVQMHHHSSAFCTTVRRVALSRHVHMWTMWIFSFAYMLSALSGIGSGVISLHGNYWTLQYLPYFVYGLLVIYACIMMMRFSIELYLAQYPTISQSLSIITGHNHARHSHTRASYDAWFVRTIALFFGAIAKQVMAIITTLLHEQQQTSSHRAPAHGDATIPVPPLLFNTSNSTRISSSTVPCHFRDSAPITAGVMRIICLFLPIIVAEIGLYLQRRSRTMRNQIDAYRIATEDNILVHMGHGGVVSRMVSQEVMPGARVGQDNESIAPQQQRHGEVGNDMIYTVQRL